MNEGGFKPVHRAGPSWEDGRPVGTVDPDFGDEATPEPAADVDALTLVLAQFIDGAPVGTIGQRFLVLAYLAGSPGAPRSQRALARRLGISLGASNAMFQRIREEMGRIGKKRLQRQPIIEHPGHR